MTKAPDMIPENIDFAARELLEAPEADRPAMLEGIAKGADQAFAAGQSGHRSSGDLGSASRFVKAVWDRLS
jgi:hypothetical protein